MRLGWDEIKRRARGFSEEWKDAGYERGETQSFYNDFFQIFGVQRRKFADYERRVKLSDDRHGFIDAFWPGVLLIEQKSSRLDLRKAELQGLDYLAGIPENQQPRYMLTCDFQTWVLRDRDASGEPLTFKLKDLDKHVEAFDFMLGRRVTFQTQATVTIKAAELMGRLHDALEESGYRGHDLEQLLVRLLFCMFADDTGIFQPKDIFLQLIDNDTADDGRNVGATLNELFDVLDTPPDERQRGLGAELNQFDYINGALFRGRLRTPAFDAEMRTLLIDACRHDWSGVSPAIFGSLFQSVMDAKERRAKGAHYTSEANIMKVIGPLFLDDLRAELDRVAARRSGREAALIEFQHKLSRLTFLDPACGCGNFLVVAYRELRRLELACLKALYPDQRIDAVLLSRVTVEQFYGIEIEEFPARIAEVAMWMADHLANNEYNEAFQGNTARIPLKDSAHIRHADALDTDWSTLIAPDRLHYIMGNPPFVGAKFQTVGQRAQVRAIAGLGGSGGTLDFVAAWFIKAGQFAAANPRIRIAFVATNSISQGEQVAQLWPILFDRFHLEIAFAHRTFSWGSEARGKAHVHVVVIGLTHRDYEPGEKRLFSYPDIKRDPVETRHGALTAYLFDARGVTNRHLVVREEGKPLNGLPKLITGSKPLEDGHLVLDHKERDLLIEQYPQIAEYVRPYQGAEEFINGWHRWVIATPLIPPELIRSIPPLMDRLNAIRQWRSSRGSKTTLDLANAPTQWHLTVLPGKPFLAVPNTSSERREYAPVGWINPPVIPNQN